MHAQCAMDVHAYSMRCGRTCILSELWTYMHTLLKKKICWRTISLLESWIYTRTSYSLHHCLWSQLFHKSCSDMIYPSYVHVVHMFIFTMILYLYSKTYFFLNYGKVTVWLLANLAVNNQFGTIYVINNIKSDYRW